MAKSADFNLQIAQFPNLDSEGFEKTSDATSRYNCIAWSNSDDAIWWWPQFGPVGVNYWPSGVPFDDTLDTFQKMFRLDNYEVCNSSDFEEGIEKIAIYMRDAHVTHAARQLQSGKWTSKIGRNIDLTHDTLRALEGPLYGDVACIMERKRALSDPIGEGVLRPGDK